MLGSAAIKISLVQEEWGSEKNLRHLRNNNLLTGLSDGHDDEIKVRIESDQPGK